MAKVVVEAVVMVAEVVAEAMVMVAEVVVLRRVVVEVSAGHLRPLCQVGSLHFIGSLRRTPWRMGRLRG